MSQWGVEKIVKGARFLPHVDSNAFQQITNESTVTSILMIDDGGNIEIADKCHAELSIEFIGKHYSKWLEAMPPNAKGQRGAACGASAAPTGCASNGTTEKEE